VRRSLFGPVSAMSGKGLFTNLTKSVDSTKSNHVEFILACR
jgi:hypothetical protein